MGINKKCPWKFTIRDAGEQGASSAMGRPTGTSVWPVRAAPRYCEEEG